MYVEVRKIKLLDSSTLPMTLTRKSISFLGWIENISHHETYDLAKFCKVGSVWVVSTMCRLDAEWAEALATKPVEITSVPGPHLVEGKENSRQFFSDLDTHPGTCTSYPTQ